MRTALTSAAIGVTLLAGVSVAQQTGRTVMIKGRESEYVFRLHSSVISSVRKHYPPLQVCRAKATCRHVVTKRQRRLNRDAQAEAH